MRIRLRYAKRGPLRFSSHRDFQRAFERALRRVDVPMAYSAGFRPHPKISYANAAATGSASEAEYVEIGLSARIDLETLAPALDDAMPPGLDIIEAVEALTPDLVGRLEASEWRIEFPGVADPELATAVTQFIAADEVMVSRMTKSGRRHFDARSAVVHAEVGAGATDPTDTNSAQNRASNEPCAILKVVVTHGTPSVRPDDVVAALHSVADFEPPLPPRVTRLAQGQLSADVRAVSDPLEADRRNANSAHS